MDIQETTLPGVGLRHDFTTRDGRPLGVMSYRTGRRDLLLYDPDDADTCQEVIRLTQEEADALADLLGAARLIRHLIELQQQVEGLAISWLTIQASSPYAGGTIADTQARTRTGVSIVAVLRGPDSLPRTHPRLRLPGRRHGAGGRHPSRRPGPGQTPGRMTGMGNVIDGAESRGNVLGQTITTPSPDACRPGKDQRAPP